MPNPVDPRQLEQLSASLSGRLDDASYIVQVAITSRIAIWA